MRKLVATTKSDLQKYDDLVAKVHVDKSASTQLLMVESLFLCLKRPTRAAGMDLSFSEMKKIVLDKLPGKYKVDVEKLEDIRGPSTDLKELWSLCRLCVNGIDEKENDDNDIYSNMKEEEDQYQHEYSDSSYNLRSRNDQDHDQLLQYCLFSIRLNARKCSLQPQQTTNYSFK